MTLRDYKLIFRLAKSILEQEYHNLSLWYFVSFICGIGTYFTLSSEPSFISILGSVDKNFNVTILKFQRNLEKLRKWLEPYQI